MFNKVINLISIVIVVAQISVTIFALCVGVPFKSDVIGNSAMLAIYLILIYLGKGIIGSALKQRKIPKDKRQSKNGGTFLMVAGSFFLFAGIIICMGIVMNIYETKMDAVEYSSGKIVSDTMKVDYVRIETSHSKNDSVFNSKTKSIRIVKGISGTSIKTNKKLKFDYCSLYESQVLKGEVYEVKYLPTTHRILSIKLKK